MSDIVIFESGKTPVYLKSVNTPDYDSNPDVVVNPDLSKLTKVPIKYWERDGNLVKEMNTSEKVAIDFAELQVKKDAVVLDDSQKALVAILSSKGISITENDLLTEIRSKIT